MGELVGLAVKVGVTVRVGLAVGVGLFVGDGRGWAVGVGTGGCEAQAEKERVSSSAASMVVNRIAFPCVWRCRSMCCCTT